jgi:hypothetical protein
MYYDTGDVLRKYPKVFESLCPVLAWINGFGVSRVKKTLGICLSKLSGKWKLSWEVIFLRVIK